MTKYTAHYFLNRDPVSYQILLDFSETFFTPELIESKIAAKLEMPNATITLRKLVPFVRD